MKNTKIKRMVKAGRQVRGMPVAKRVRRPPMPAPPHEDAESITVEDDTADLSTYKVEELRQMAKQAGVKGYSKMRKADLVEALSS